MRARVVIGRFFVALRGLTALPDHLAEFFGGALGLGGLPAPAARFLCAHTGVLILIVIVR
jgi:hypothetical protein